MRFPARIAALLSVAVVFLVPAIPAFPQGITEAAPQPSSASGRWSPPSSLVIPEANDAPPVQVPPAPQNSNELTLPSLGNQQASLPPKSDSTKVIPVIPPNQEVLVLPQAS